MNQIKNRFNGEIICEGEESIKKLAERNKADLSGIDLSGADLSGADLSEANLSRTNLSGANLSEADLDFSCWPLWCGTKGVKLDRKQWIQIFAAHGCVVEVDDPEIKEMQAKLLPLAKQCHRAEELNLK